MNYTPPSSVNSPKDCVSNVQVVYDGGDKSVSVAKLDWDGEPCIAMRWNVARREWDDPEKKSGKRMAVGMPTSHGYPVWLILPNKLLKKNSKIWKKIEGL